MTTLPTARTILTSLIHSIGASPISHEAALTDQYDHRGSSHPFPPSHRTLLTTLHVLFPNLLLPALDLLDHSLVTRVIPEENISRPGPNLKDDGKTSASEARSSTPTSDSLEEEPNPRAETAFYLVRSAASVHPRRNVHRRPHPAVTAPYLVRLDAWNCSCASFAFDAFPASAPAADETLPATWCDIEGAGDVAAAPAASWSFGGMTLDRAGGGGADDVPCCKHLLACLLAERCGDVVGRYVVERRVGKEEMAGLVATT